MKDSKVLFVCTQMEAGGAQTLAMAMTAAMREHGVDAKVAFLYEKRSVFAGAPGVVSLLERRPSLLEVPTVLWRLLRLVRSFRPTSIVGMAHYASPLACLIGFLCGVPVRMATQTSPLGSKNRLARWIDLVCGTIGMYTDNVAASRTIEADYRNYPSRYRAVLRTIYNGVSLVPSKLSVTAARRHFGLDPAAFMLVTCGRLAPVKNHRLLLEVVERIPGAHLAILGEGELRGALESEIERKGLAGRVALLGEFDHSKVAGFLRCGDLFLFPSSYEAFGIAAVEAMQAGLPVIASDYPAIAEVVGDAGVLLPSGDEDAWVEAVLALKQDEERRRLVAERCLARGCGYSFSRMFGQYKMALVG